MLKDDVILKAYEILGVGENASRNEVDQAFRKQARNVHPDTQSPIASNSAFTKLTNARDEIYARIEETQKITSESDIAPQTTTNSFANLPSSIIKTFYKPCLIAIKPGIQGENIRIAFWGKENSQVRSLWNCQSTVALGNTFRYTDFHKHMRFICIAEENTITDSHPADAIVILASSPNEITDGLVAIQTVERRFACNYERYSIEYGGFGEVHCQPIENFSTFHPQFIRARLNPEWIQEDLIPSIAQAILKAPGIIIQPGASLRNIIRRHNKDYKTIFWDIRTKYLELLTTHFSKQMDTLLINQLIQHMSTFMDSILWPILDQRAKLLTSLVNSHSKYPSFSWSEDKEILSAKIDVLTVFLKKIEPPLFQIFAMRNPTLNQIMSVITKPIMQYTEPDSRQEIQDDYYYRAACLPRKRGIWRQTSQPVTANPITYSSKNRHATQDMMTRNLLGNLLTAAVNVFSALSSVASTAETQQPLTENTTAQNIHRLFYDSRTENILRTAREQAQKIQQNHSMKS